MRNDFKENLFTHTFKALRHELGHDRPTDDRPLWEQRLSDQSDFCRAVVACGYLTVSHSGMELSINLWKLMLERIYNEGKE